MRSKISYEDYEDGDSVPSVCGNFPLACLNGGDCVKKSWRKSRFPVPVYICRCAPGFKGKQCQYKIVDYSKQPIPRISTVNLVVIGILVVIVALVAAAILFKCIKNRKKRKEKFFVTQPRKMEKPPHLTVEIPEEPKLRSSNQNDQVRRRSRTSKDLSVLEENIEDIQEEKTDYPEVFPQPIVIKLPPQKSRHLSQVEVPHRGRLPGNSYRLASLQENFYSH